jgi:hypothetical protein
MVGMREFYLIFSFFSFCRRIYLEVMLMLALFFWIGIFTLYYSFIILPYG